MSTKKIRLFFNNPKNNQSTNRKFDFINDECHVNNQVIAEICKEVGILVRDFQDIDLPNVKAIYSDKSISFVPEIKEFGDVIVQAIEDK